MKKLICLILVVWVASINAQGITNTLGGNTGDDKFIIENNNGDPLLTITGNGRIGVGMSDPYFPFIMRGSAYSNILFQDNYTGGSASDGLWVGTSGDNQNYIWNYENTSLIFGTNNITRMKIENTGDVNIYNSELNRTSTSDANLVPIAYGSIGGIPPVISADTGNCTVEWSTAGNDHYEISIDNHNYNDHDYVTLVTLLGVGLDRIVSIDGYDNELVVYIYDISANETVQNSFHFVTYKP